MSLLSAALGQIDEFLFRATQCGAAADQGSDRAERELFADQWRSTAVAADAGVHQERLARDELADLVTAFAGPAPCCLIVEGVVIALADDADGMAVVREGRVVRI